MLAVSAIDQDEESHARSERDRLVIWLTYRAGLRIAETLSVTVASFDRDGALHIDRLKGSKDTVTKLDADTVSQVHAYIASRGFSDEDKLFDLDKSTVNYFFERYCKAAGIDRAKSNRATHMRCGMASGTCSSTPVRLCRRYNAQWDTCSAIAVEIKAPWQLTTSVSPSQFRGSATPCASIATLRRTRVLRQRSRARSEGISPLPMRRQWMDR